MVPALIATVMILGIMVYQIVHGLYSALIMAVLTVLSALAAIALYEPLCQAFLYERMGAYAEGTALTCLFLLILLGTRELADRFLRSTIVLGVWPDRIVGGATGLLAGTVVVGMLSLGLQLLPFGRSAAGYTPCDESLVHGSGLWVFYPDEFVLGMAKRLSVGALGTRPFADVHHDLVQEAYATRNRLITGVPDSDRKLIPSLVGELSAPDGCFRVREMYDLTDTGDLRKQLQEPIKRIQDAGLKDPLLPKGADPEKVIVAVRVAVRDTARDADTNWRLPASHFRLVDPEGVPHYPLGYIFVVLDQEIDMPRKSEIQAAGLINWNLAAAPTAIPPGGTDTFGRLRIADLVVQRGPREGVNGELFIDWVFCLPKKLWEKKPGPPTGFHMVFRGRQRAEFESKEIIHGRLPTTDLSLRHAYLLPRATKLP